MNASSKRNIKSASHSSEYNMSLTKTKTLMNIQKNITQTSPIFKEKFKIPTHVQYSYELYIDITHSYDQNIRSEHRMASAAEYQILCNSRCWMVFLLFMRRRKH
ncbi:hypothetical protein O3G_MSEX005747 [Manduca sexta]|uniref:Uncharacterized protein n=1 Tax=Manduca sexta TaxID=7130 RepID=A0A921YZS8_MANSE|nr:hypothetical protein O3G_MSEX005747 [Manduca sexta]